ncbi:hypothetical protein Patl1_19837 [Pistacia atlantica]|uniref:Uncharacterized protein n=1 Tax=Pistacia atlantica TaxID=434234 RepID=A0ACC1BHP9_9ROSI|nr:hypothetical protein Patl1_19837 [Pistacia atlantica]
MLKLESELDGKWGTKSGTLLQILSNLRLMYMPNYKAFDPTSYSLVRDKYAYNLDKDAELDWVEPSLHLSNSRMLQPYGPDRVYDAFHLLQTEPSIQCIFLEPSAIDSISIGSIMQIEYLSHKIKKHEYVTELFTKLRCNQNSDFSVSFSNKKGASILCLELITDQAVWKAVLNNEVVRELKESFYAAAEDSESECSTETCDDSNPAMNIINLPDDETPTTGSKTAGATDPFEEKLRTSFLLSVMVLLVVVVTRAGWA